MASSVKHVVVHIEDDATHWQPLTQLLSVAIAEYLDGSSDGEVDSLEFITTGEPYRYPSKTVIKWEIKRLRYEVWYYWLEDAASVPTIASELGDNDKRTFILDVMRPRADVGLCSFLEETLAAIASFVDDQASQVRLFTAYSEADGIKFPVNSPDMFKKGVET